MISKLKEKKPMSLAQWAYISIKDYIINNNLEPGSQLNIEELTLELNIRSEERRVGSGKTHVGQNTRELGENAGTQQPFGAGRQNKRI